MKNYNQYLKKYKFKNEFDEIEFIFTLSLVSRIQDNQKLLLSPEFIELLRSRIEILNEFKVILYYHYLLFI